MPKKRRKNNKSIRSMRKSIRNESRSIIRTGQALVGKILRKKIRSLDLIQNHE
jgi:hypothetical protein